MEALDQHVKFSPISIRTLHDGKQFIFRFANGLGASVVSHSYSYGNKDEFELAVIEFYEDAEMGWNITYDTPITDDVIGYLKWDEVEDLLDRIESLVWED